MSGWFSRWFSPSFSTEIDIGAAAHRGIKIGGAGCTHPWSSGYNHCPYCGALLQWRCACGLRNPNFHAFCTSCGTGKPERSAQAMEEP